MNDQEWYGIGLDTSQLKRDAQNVRNEFTQIGNTAYNEGMRIDRTFQNLYRGAIAYLSVQQLSQYANQIVQIRGEFQQLSIAFETMLGSKAKADALMAEQIALAQKSPFTLLDVATNTKQLLAMGIAVEDVMGTMKSLGDVAAGVSVPISRIAVNYGQVATLGKLQTREIRDFAMAGIPLIDELAKNLGKTKTEIDDMVEKSAIGFPEVEKAFQTMTSEGGKFYNLMEKQNKSVTGQISNVKDKIQVMMNDIGQSNEGIIYSGIEGANKLISNYEEIGKVLTGLVLTYGTYKAALITVAALERVVVTNKTAMLYLEMAAGLGTVTTAHRARAVAMGIEAKAQAALNAVMAINPYVLIATAVVGAAAAIWLLHDSTTAQEKAQKRLNDELEEAKTKKDNLISKSNELINTLNDETTSIYKLRGAYRELQGMFPEAFKGVSLEEYQNMADNDVKVKINTIIDDRQFDEAKKKYEEALERLSNIQKNIDLFKENPHAQSMVSKLNNELKEAQEYAKLTKQQLDNITEDRSIPQNETERLVYYTAQLDSLKKQRDEIEEMLLKSEGLTGEWGNFGVQSILNAQKLDDLNKKIDETSKKIGALTGEKISIQNKSYWEEQKKAAESALEAMSGPQDDLKKWNDNLAKLHQAQQKLKIWDFSTKASEAKIKVEEDKLKALAELKQKEVDLELDYSNAIINAMADGFAKQKEVAKQQFRERIAQLDKEENEYLDKLNESKALKSTDSGYIQSLSDYVSKNESDTGAASFLQNLNNMRMAADMAYVNASDKIDDIKKQNERDSMNEYLKEFGTYQQKRLSITELYAEKIANAETEGERLSLTGQRDKELQELDAELIEKSNLWARLFEDAERHTAKYIEETIRQAQQLIDYLNGVEGVEIPIGFSDEQINSLKKDPEALKQILAGLTRQRDELDKRNPFKNLIQGFKDLKATGKDTEKQFAATNKIINGLDGAASIIGSVADAFGSVDEQAGNALNKVGEVIDQTASFAGMGAQVGGAYGAIIGGALGLVTSLAKVISDSKKEREAAEAERQAAAMEKLNTSIELNNKLLEDAADANYWAVLANQVENYDEKIKTLTDDIKDAIPKYTNDVYEKYADDYQAYVDQVQREARIRAEARYGTNPDNEWKIEAAVNDAMRSINYNDWLEENLSPVMFPSTEFLNFEQIRDAWAQGNLELSKEAEQLMLDLIETQEAKADMLQRQYQSFLGFAKDDMTSSIADGIAEGLNLGEDGLGEFAKGFGEQMKKYAGQSLERFLNEKYLNDMYETAFEFSKTGGIIDEDERKALEKMYEDAVAAGQNYYEAFKGLFSDGSANGYNALTGTTVNATEESVSLLYGMTTAMRIDLKGIGTDIIAIDENTRQATDYLMKGLVVWERIAENTSYNKNLVPIYEELQTINKTLIEKLS